MPAIGADKIGQRHPQRSGIDRPGVRISVRCGDQDNGGGDKLGTPAKGAGKL